LTTRAWAVNTDEHGPDPACASREPQASDGARGARTAPASVEKATATR
jgi:hypothetical protein